MNDILDKAIELLRQGFVKKVSNQHKVTKQTYCSDEMVKEPYAYNYCTIGAVFTACLIVGREADYEIVLDRIRNSISRFSIAGFNDDPDTTVDDVIKILERSKLNAS